MEIVIRENIKQHMQELSDWLIEVEEVPLEEMSAFFSARMDMYEEHMSVWKQAYEKFAALIPAGCGNILDLGCGTGLELDEIFKRYPQMEVTGVDMCQDMLDELLKKHGERNLSVVCQDYFQYEMGNGQWEAALSFESLHHFLPDEKMRLYRKICDALRPDGLFLLGDYIACCDEEERLLQKVCTEKRKKYHIPKDQFIHFDIPLTLTHELDLLRKAGFLEAAAVDSIEGATMILARK